MSELKIIEVDKNHLPKIMKMLAAGTVLAGAVVAPNILSLLSYQMSGKQKNAKLLRSIRYANSRGWIILEERPDGVHVALTKSGKSKWQKLVLDEPLHQKSWDKKWRIVLFDIPVSRRNNAFAFREGIKKLGFMQLQKSVWITPYPCEKEIAALRQMYEVKDCTQLLIASHIENESELRANFSI